MYKYVKKLLPLSFKNIFILNRDIHSIQTRNSSKFNVPFPGIDKSKFSVTHAAPSATDVRIGGDQRRRVPKNLSKLAN